MTYDELIKSDLSIEEKNILIRELREQEYLKLWDSPRAQIEYESRHGSGTIRIMKDEIRSRFAYIEK